jgi:hypothetical protein
MSDKTQGISESVVLQGDNGAQIAFRGRLFSESAYYDEDTEVITHLRLYVTDDGAHVYSIVSGVGAQRSRRHYTVRLNGKMCSMSDGKQSMTLPVDLLFTSVFGLCGIDPALAEDLRPVLEEALYAANG